MVDLVRGFVRHPREELDDIMATTQWGQTEVLRYDRYVPENRLGAGLRADSRTLLRQTDLHLQSRYHANFEGVAALLYRDGNDFQGLHSDRAMRWLDDTLVAIVVLGGRWSSRRGRPDTNPGHYDGRQFSGDVTRAGSRTRRSTS